ncbi:MAG: E3 ubiquitin-protein ligase hrd1 [Phylliscum demangeonii]|nr:MAG: E3 ubiquitin-protein ligase hrd1 [Phylliscum demangeonii]
MRLAAYAGTSTVLAAAVVLRAFHERANFYSACVYLSQSNACLMILTNLVLLLVGLSVMALQRLLYGQLRAIEIEQLYEKAWFAITETCLAMTIFREEVGGWFLAMFVALLVGRVWGWIGEGRVETVEQQPPANPRLFHARLAFSLALSMVFDVALMRYAISTVLRMARPTMMVMFAFEFAVLTISSVSTAARYMLTLFDIHTIQRQTQLKLAERRAQLQAIQAQHPPAEAGAPTPTAGLAPPPGGMDEADIDVPGWEAKGQWMFYLDLVTDFLKLVVYLAFFSILLTFYGLPIHIMRDLFLTLRSFTKRIVDFVRYRRATRDMNERYPDASADEIGPEEVCIICREEMRPWRAAPPANANANAVPPANAAQPAPADSRPIDQRTRPKKLPCGHVLHFGCLRSWLERQQICPTCRRPVMGSARAGGEPRDPALPPPAAGQAGHAPAGRAANRGRVINIGPLRLVIGNGNAFQDLVRQVQNGPAGAVLPGGLNANANADANANPAPNHAEAANRPLLTFGLGFARPARAANAPNAPSPTTPPTRPRHVQPEPGRSIQAQLQSLEQVINLEVSRLGVTGDQLRVYQSMQMEATRLRARQDHLRRFERVMGGNSVANGEQAGFRPPPSTANPLPFPPSAATLAAAGGPSTSRRRPPSPPPALPPGLTVPPGWTVVPFSQMTRRDSDGSASSSGSSGSWPDDVVPGRFRSSFRADRHLVDYLSTVGTTTTGTGATGLDAAHMPPPSALWTEPETGPAPATGPSPRLTATGTATPDTTDGDVVVAPSAPPLAARSPSGPSVPMWGAEPRPGADRPRSADDPSSPKARMPRASSSHPSSGTRSADGEREGTGRPVTVAEEEEDDDDGDDGLV